jgi:alpha-glucoside transport system substrate-binding protein
LAARGLKRRGFLVGLGFAALPLLAACAGKNSATSTAVPTSGAAPSLAGASTPSASPAVSPTSAAAAATPVATTTAGATPVAGAATASPGATVTAGATTVAGAATASPGATPGATTVAAQGTSIPKLGGTVSVLATWGGDEQDSFLAMVKPFEDQSGAKVQYTGTRDLNAVLTTRTQAGNPPDLAGLPGPGQMAEFARAGKLIPLDTILNKAQLADQYSNTWLSLASVNDQLVGIFIKAALKSQIWYNAKAFQQGGYQVPKTWDDLMTLSQKIAGTGTTPWSIGLESGASSGWPGTDWIEDLVLRQAGPDAYDRWWQGSLKWTSPEITQAWQTWGKIVGDPKMVYGGPQYVLSTNFGNAADPLFQNPPKAYLHHSATFITSFITKDNPNAKPVTDFNFFMFPDINAQYAGAVEGAGDLFGMFKKTDQSSALISYLTTPDAQQIWVKRGGALSPNRQVPSSAYPDDLSRLAAQQLVGAKIVRFDASDMMPDAMNLAFYKAVLDFVQNPSQLTSILQTLDKTQASSYPH